MPLQSLLSKRHPRKRLCFQVMSDLHLEIGQQYNSFKIIPHASRLILAGDIGRLADYDAFRDFLRVQCLSFEAVYLVLGNHEFFGVSRAEGLRLADMLQQEPVLKDKLFVMNRRRIDILDVTLFGCTLHSYIPAEAQEIVQHKINDFRRIVNWTVADHIAEHQKDLQWLADEINSIRGGELDSKRRIVVITHHAPSKKGTSKPSDEGNPWSSAFGTDILKANDSTPFNDVQLWVFGHTHFTTALSLGPVRLISNQRGYVLPGQEKEVAPRSESIMAKGLKVLGYGAPSPASFDANKVIEV